MRHLKIFLFFLAICFLGAGIVQAGDFEGTIPMDAAATYFFQDSYSGKILQFSYDNVTKTLVGTFGDWGPAYGMYMYSKLVWSFNLYYPSGGYFPVTFVCKMLSKNPYVFETYWVNGEGYKEGPYILTQATVLGVWDLYYDWGCVGIQGLTWIEFFDDGTFTTGQGSSGTWTQLGDQVEFVFVPSGTTYTGTINGDYMSGTMHNPSGSTGCWEANRTGSKLEGKGYTDNGVDASGQ